MSPQGAGVFAERKAMRPPPVSDQLTGPDRNMPRKPSINNPAGGGSHQRMVRPACLFVCKRSVYKTLAADCYDIDRDARTYAGNAPVVAHPPCQLWGKMANVNFKRWGGEHNRPGNDGGCFSFALDAVNRCGGVLEHPAETYAWKAYGLTKPHGIGWQPSGEGWVCEVWQSAYGHRARKRTWLYCHGTQSPLEARWERKDGTHQVGFHDQRGKARNKPTLCKREANATPPEFAEYLIALAVTCAKWPNKHISN